MSQRNDVASSKTGRLRQDMNLIFIAAFLSMILVPFASAAETPGAPALPDGVFMAMRTQLNALRPVLGDPQAMAHAWAAQLEAPGYVADFWNKVTAALVIKRAYTDPAADAAVSRSLAVQNDPQARQVLLDLADLRRSLKNKPEEHAEFLRMLRPLEQMLDQQNVKDGLDSIFAGSIRRSASPDSDGVLAQNTLAHSGDKVEAPLKPMRGNAARVGNEDRSIQRLGVNGPDLPKLPEAAGNSLTRAFWSLVGSINPRQKPDLRLARKDYERRLAAVPGVKKVAFYHLPGTGEDIRMPIPSKIGVDVQFADEASMIRAIEQGLIPAPPPLLQDHTVDVTYFPNQRDWRADWIMESPKGLRAWYGEGPIQREYRLYRFKAAE